MLARSEVQSGIVVQALAPVWEGRASGAFPIAVAHVGGTERLWCAGSGAGVGKVAAALSAGPTWEAVLDRRLVKGSWLVFSW